MAREMAGPTLAAPRRIQGKEEIRAMAESDQPSGHDDSGPVPFMQRVLDNPFLLLFLGVTLPAVLYIIWGVMEIANIPIAK
jgi:hypothetical protein